MEVYLFWLNQKNKQTKQVNNSRLYSYAVLLGPAAKRSFKKLCVHMFKFPPQCIAVAVCNLLKQHPHS